MRQIFFRFIAFGILFGFASGLSWQFPALSEPLFVMSGLSFLAAVGVRVKMWRDKVADPYSLHKLDEIMREGTYNEEDVPEIDHDGDKYCLNCHTVYGSQFGVCPNCAKRNSNTCC